MGKKKKKIKRHPGAGGQAARGGKTFRLPAGNGVKRNANRNAGDGDVLKRYAADSRYQTRLCEMYDDMYKNAARRKILDEMNDDLMRYAAAKPAPNPSGGYVPPYAAYTLHIFKEYLQSYTDHLKSVPEHAFFNPDGGMDAAPPNKLGRVLLLPLIYAHKSKRMEDGLADRDECNACKLLESFFSRFAFCLDIRMNEIDAEGLSHLDDNLDALSSRALVQRFFMAVQKREKAVAYKLLGRARDLDPGEADYLEAMARYYDEDYEEAIRYALRVREDYPDYGQAVAILLEAHAARGDLRSVVETIRQNGKVKFQVLQIVFLFQEAIRNLTAEADEDWLEQMTECFERASLTEKGGTEYYDRIVRNTGECILELYQYFRDLSFYAGMDESAAREGETFPDERTYMALLPVVDLFYDAGMKELTDELLAAVERNAADDAWLRRIRDMAARTFNRIAIELNPTKSMDATVYALDFQYRLGLVKDFTRNIDRNIEALSRYYDHSRDERVAGVILSAYAEEAAKARPDPRVRAFVESHMQGDAAAETLTQKRLRSRLSKNALVALESADMLYALSESIDWGWRDAGMISLAYFRIIEVELNSKIVFPLVERIGIERVRNLYDSTRARLRGEEKQDFSARWGRLVSTLEKIEAGTAETNGLMLGEMEYFFRNIGSERIPDDALAEELTEQLRLMLAEDVSAEDLIDLIENGIIKREIRDKYRNPPAHTRYLPYQTARECRDFFYDVMLQLVTALRP